MMRMDNRVGEYEISRPLESDFDEIVALWEASVRATHNFLAEEDILFFKPLIRNEYLYQVNLYCVRNSNNRIMAFMGIGGQMIEMLFILPSARGTGLGAFLVAYAVGQLSVNRVDVNEQNNQAVGFYLHLGFKIISRDATDGSGKPFPILHLSMA